MVDVLDQGRQSFERQAWGDAYAQLSAAVRAEPLEPDDLERLATVAYLVGRDDESFDAWVRAHHECLRSGNTERAARCAFWLAFGLLNKGESARGGGWTDRAQRLLDERGLECVEQGYLRYLVALRRVFEGDVSTAHAAFVHAAKVGEHFRDPELTALARIGEGRCLIYLGDVAEGLALLDEAMVAVTAGEVSPIAVGDSYCTVIEGCQEVFDLRRAQEWTAALSNWCDSQPGLVPYRGQCLVHRAEIMQLHGAWTDSMREAQRACEWLSRPVAHPAVGAALYQQGELHRLRGQFTKAEEAYRQAGQRGREPQPGLTQLRLAQGQIEAAEAAIRRVVNEAEDRVTRSKVLPAYVEVMLAAKEVGAARAAADELSQIAADVGAPLLHAVSAQVVGCVLLAEGDAETALASVRKALATWRELEAPYEAACGRVLIGLACRELGDDDTAEMELDAARRVFEQLGAAPDVARVKELSGTATPMTAGGLTSREVQVLALVAAGKTNRKIADELSISDKTVARHVSNIFIKLGVSSRSAATAYAYEHGLV